MQTSATSCLVCKVACLRNQSLVCCTTCKLHAHVKCAKVGMNFGKNNFVCVGCHQKRAFLSSLAKSSSTSNIPTKNNVYPARSSHLYHSVENVNSMLQSKQVGDLFIIHINASSLPKHFDTISSLCIDKFNRHPDVICITESRLKDKKIDYQLKLVDLDEYNLLYDNSKTSAGGVAVYVKTNIFDFQIKSDLRVKVNDCESVFLEFDFSSKNTINKKSRTFLLGCVYRHPRRKVSEKNKFIEEIYKTLKKYSDKNIPLVILGDININVKNLNDNTVQRYTNILTSLGCKNLIDINTRFAKNSRSTLDHILTNIDDDQITSGVLNFPISDHLPVFALIRNHANVLEKK